MKIISLILLSALPLTAAVHTNSSWHLGYSNGVNGPVEVIEIAPDKSRILQRIPINVPEIPVATTNIITGSMFTNIQAKISTTIVTNVASGDNSSGCNICYGKQFGHFSGEVIPSTPATWPPSNCQPYKEATERWTISNIIARVEVSVKWKDKDLVHVEETPISSVTNRWKLSTEWKKE